LKTFSFLSNYFLLFFFSNIYPANTLVFSSDTTLEIFAFMPRSDITCEALLIQDPDIFKDPFATAKATSINDGSSLYFLLERLPAQVGIIIFIRAINLVTRAVYAHGCVENIYTAARERKEISLHLTPKATAR
jgi:hypothetical protein